MIGHLERIAIVLGILYPPFTLGPPAWPGEAQGEKDEEAPQGRSQGVIEDLAGF